jgi:hypothetical protein
MTMIRRSLVSAIALMGMAALGVETADAQATRAWVSGVGDDLNPCSRTAPCKTFAGAISKTAAGGEIDCLDPGGFGAVTITKSLTIDCGTFTGGISASGVSGIIINAGVSDRVVIRNLVINGFGTGLNGIRLLQARHVLVENVAISGMTGNGIDMANASIMSLVVRDTRIGFVLNGLKMSGAGTGVANLDNVGITAATRGVELAVNTAFATINDSQITQSFAAAVATTAGNGVINVENSILTQNVLAVSAGSAGSLIRLSNNSIYNNTTGFSAVAGATIATANNNKTGGNGGAGAPNGNVTIQ